MITKVISLSTNRTFSYQSTFSLFFFFYFLARLDSEQFIRHTNYLMISWVIIDNYFFPDALSPKGVDEQNPDVP